MLPSTAAKHYSSRWAYAKILENNGTTRQNKIIFLDAVCNEEGEDGYVPPTACQDEIYALVHMGILRMYPLI